MTVLGSEYERVEGADHLFDREPQHTMDTMYAFIKKQFGMSS